MTISSESTPSTTTTRSVKDHEGPSNNDNDHMPTLSTPTPPHFNQPQATQCVKMAMAAAAVAVSRHDTFGATGIFFPYFLYHLFLYYTQGALCHQRDYRCCPHLPSWQLQQFCDCCVWIRGGTFNISILEMQRGILSSNTNTNTIVNECKGLKT